jgi:hypothetical protein
MNSTSASMTNGLLCPYDSRRTSTELVIKHFVVHLTTITAFCHLLSIRNKPLLRFRPLFYVFMPFNIIVQHVLAILAILINYWLFFCCRSVPLSDAPKLHTSFSWLLGVVPDSSGVTGRYGLPNAMEGPIIRLGILACINFRSCPFSENGYLDRFLKIVYEIYYYNTGHNLKIKTSLCLTIESSGL